MAAVLAEILAYLELWLRSSNFIDLLMQRIDLGLGFRI